MTAYSKFSEKRTAAKEKGTYLGAKGLAAEIKARHENVKNIGGIIHKVGVAKYGARAFQAAAAHGRHIAAQKRQLGVKKMK